MSDEDEITTVARKSTLIFSLRMLISIFSTVGFIIVARYMSVEDVGMIGFALGFVGIFLLTDYGFSMAHKKKVSEGKDIGECMGTYVIIKLALLVILIIVLLSSLFIWESVLGHGYQDPLIKSVILIIVAYYILFAISKIFTQTFAGLRQSAKQQMPELVGTFARIPLMVFIALTSLGVVALAFSYVVTGIVMVVLGAFLLRNIEFKKPSKSMIMSYIHFAAPVGIYTVFSAISLNVDKVTLQFFWDSTEVGYFFATQKMVLSLTVIATSIPPIFFPSISYYHSRKQKKLVRQLLSTAERYISMILVPAVVAFAVLSPEIIHITLGDHYQPAAMVLVILSFYALFFSLNLPHMQVLYGCNRPKTGAKVGIIIAATNTILLFILVPRELFGYTFFGLGAEGAAIASLISVFVGFILSRYYTKRVIKSNFNSKILRHWAAGLGMALTIIAITYIMTPSRWFSLLSVSGIGFLSYMGILILLKELRKRDLRFFLEILSPGKMGSYLKKEFKE